MAHQEKKTDFCNTLVESLLAAYGPVVGGEKLVKLLGYSSSQAFRQAQCRRTVPVSVFSIPHRRGKFAFTHEIAKWLSELRSQ